MAKIIDGKRIAQDIKAELEQRIDALMSRGCQPGLSVVLVGENPASEIYVRMKTRTAAELGIRSNTIKLPAEASERELLQVVEQLNDDEAVHGILVQLPLPPQIDENHVIHAIVPHKDVDGFHPVNRGKLLVGEETLVPCTPLGIQELLLRSNHDPAGKHVVIVGRSRIVGLPLANMLVQKRKGANATVTVCHTGTRELGDFTRQADILIAAVGKPEVINGSMIKVGAVVVDVGVNRVDDPGSEKGYRVVGDVEFDSAAEKAAAITPVPGGVGPMTIAMLMHNTVKCASSSTG
ncbi:MAG: bifunctional methylenetetrahydrofolate dehydrogenase/methenyltetrahydrofolate cyclohydrolase FolD [bacterium]